MQNPGRSRKMKAWWRHYWGQARMNATEAARLAGYAWPNKSGPRLAQEFATEISEQLSELAMSPEEVAGRLGEIARASPEDFIDIHPDGSWSWNFAKARDAGKLHLIKKIKEGKWGVEVAWHDAHQALRDLGRKHGIFTDKMEADVTHHFPGFEKALDAIYGDDGNEEP